MMRQTVKLKVKENLTLVIPFDEHDSFYSTPEGVEFVVIRRPHFLVKGWIYRKTIVNGEVVYEGEVIKYIIQGGASYGKEEG